MDLGFIDKVSSCGYLFSKRGTFDAFTIVLYWNGVDVGKPRTSGTHKTLGAEKQKPQTSRNKRGN